MNTRCLGMGVLIGASLLAACSSTADQPDPACPRVAIVSDLSRVTLFREGGGRDLTDVSANAQLEVRNAKCTFSRTAVDVEFDLAVAASAGPADQARPYDLDYFVAVVDPDRNVTRHESYRVRMQFTATQPRQGLLEQISSRIPLRERTAAPNYDVFVGFQLTDDQLAWNRRTRGR